MLEQKPAAAVVLAAQVAVDEVLVDRYEDEPARREMLAEVAVPRVREVLHVVVAVHDQHERKWPVALRVPHATVDRELLEVESPVFRSVLRDIRWGGHHRG